MLKELFKKNLTTAEKKKLKIGVKVKDTQGQMHIPDGLFVKCESCNEIICTEDMVSNYFICSGCKHYFRIDPRARINMIVDKGSFEEWDETMEISDPLSFPGYQNKLEQMKTLTNLDEAVITGKASIDEVPVAIGVMATTFLMGSMGYIVGEKITRLAERATKERLPLILFCASGGARMQEGIISLMQMAKTSAALRRHDEEGLLYISVLTDPTTGGVMASFAMLGDVILAEPGALVGFAGPRVIEQTIGQKLPEGFQRAEFLLEHGFVDKIVKREKLRQTLSTIIRS